MRIRSVAIIAISVVIAGSRNIAAADLMPVAQQNALIGKYCAVCHTDATPNGGLSLQHFDAARPDPQLAAMLASKIKANAFGAAGLKLPDQATQDALLQALSAEAAAAEDWHVERSGDTITASVLRKAPPHIKNGKDPDLYRLTVACDPSSGRGEIQLAWSPAVPENGQTISAAVDGHAPVEYTVSAVEKMGNGTDGTSGPGALVLSGISLPERMLIVRDVFPKLSIDFGFYTLPSDARSKLAACFSSRR